MSRHATHGPAAGRLTSAGDGRTVAARPARGTRTKETTTMTDLSTHPTQIAGAWLADFQSALERRDIDAVLALFEPDCYWRDLVAFTWNIRTQEGPEAIRAMLEARLADTRPTAFAVEGDATEADGVVDAWFTFEPAVARGRGHLRLRSGKAWTPLTPTTRLEGIW